MKKGAFLFPGQGSQYAGMATHLMDNDVVSRLFDEANEILGYDLKDLCTEGSMQELTQTDVTQPAIFVTGIALFQLHKNRLPAAQFMAGHSLGEYTALTCAGAIGFPEALTLVKKRATLMKKASEQGQGTMLAVQDLQGEVLGNICKNISREGHIVSIAARNSSRQFVISGHTAAIREADEQCRQLGAYTTPVKVGAAFHSSLMAQAATELELELQRYPFKVPLCPVISNATGLPYKHEAEIIQGLTRQMTEPVNWTGCLDYMAARGVEYFIEIGPGNTLRKLLRLDGWPAVFSLDKDQEELRHFITANIGALNTVVTRSLGISMSVRNANDDPEQYQRGVVRPYTAIKGIQERLEKEKTLPRDEDIDEVLSSFCRILNTKKLKYCDKLERLKELLMGTGVMELYPRYIAHLT